MSDADATLAARLAHGAGVLLMALRDEGQRADIGAEGDRRANAWLMAALREARPDDAILSEEELADTARCALSRVWVIDPLDGTREYGEGRDDWAVHVGLAVDGAPFAGAVALPALGQVFATANAPRLIVANRPPRIVVSRSRPPEVAKAVAEQLAAELVPMGSAGAKAMAVVRGEADAYVHAGGQYEWDSCAPVAVALAAGLHASRLDGTPLVYNRPDPYLPDLLICRQDLADTILHLIADYTRHCAVQQSR